MPQTVEAVYHDGIVELKRKPAGIQRAKALVIFLDTKETRESQAVNLERVRKRKSTVDKWIGVIEGAETGRPSGGRPWKGQRREGAH